MYKGFLSKEKFDPMGLLWGHWGASFEEEILWAYFSAFLMLRICLYGLYSEVIVIGAMVSKLDSSSLSQYTARPVGGR